VIWIDVHPAGENLINTTRTLPTSVHVCSVYASYGQSPYMATFHESPTELSRVTAPEKKGSRHNPQHASWPIRWFIPNFTPEPTLKQWGQSQVSVDGRLLGLPTPYHQYAIGTFNTCSRVPTPRSLTDAGGGYHTETSEKPHQFAHPSLPSIPLVPLNGPAWSQVMHQLITNWTEGRSIPKSREWESPLDFYRNLTSEPSRS
jgi:hypothetical protein